MTFDEQVIITLIDKGLLALLIVISTFCVNLILERYKSYKSRNNEILKIRIAAMNNTWSKVYSWIVESNSKLSNITLTSEQAKTQINDSITEVIKVIEENR